jgi:hypothetical protein
VGYGMVEVGMDRKTYLLPHFSLTGLLRYLFFHLTLLGTIVRSASKFLILLYCHITCSQAGFVNPNSPVAIVRPADFEDAAKQACQTKLENAKSTYPRVEEGNLPYLCMDLVYQYTLLVDGFGRFYSKVWIVIHDGVSTNSELLTIFLRLLLSLVCRHISMARDYIGKES